MKRRIVGMKVFLVVALLHLAAAGGSAAEQDLPSIINGSWRVEFVVQWPAPSRKLIVQKWQWDARQNVLVTDGDGEYKRWQAKISGNMLQGESQNIYTGQRQIMTLHFVSSTEAKGTFQVMPGKPGGKESGLQATLHAVKM